MLLYTHTNKQGITKMYGVSFIQGMWQIKIRSTGNVYYGHSLKSVLTYIEGTLS